MKINVCAASACRNDSSDFCPLSDSHSSFKVLRIRGISSPPAARSGSRARSASGIPPTDNTGPGLCVPAGPRPPAARRGRIFSQRRSRRNARRCREPPAFLVAQDRVRDDPEDLDQAGDAAALFGRRESRFLRVGVFQEPGQVVGSLLDAGRQPLRGLRRAGRRADRVPAGAGRRGRKSPRPAGGTGRRGWPRAGRVAVVADDDRRRETPELRRLFGVSAVPIEATVSSIPARRAPGGRSSPRRRRRGRACGSPRGRPRGRRGAASSERPATRASSGTSARSAGESARPPNPTGRPRSSRSTKSRRSRKRS